MSSIYFILFSFLTDGHASHLSSDENLDDAIGPPDGLFHHILSIPTYHIGSSLIKADSHLSQSVMARSIWQYWQRGFCASFFLPFSVQRILPPDAPFLHPADGDVADDYSWNRRSLYFQTLDSSLVCWFQLNCSFLKIYISFIVNCIFEGILLIYYDICSLSMLG